MAIIILGGNSRRHKQWVRDVRETLSPLDGDIRYLDYAHWETGAEWADIAHEVTALTRVVEGLEDYVVVGKSIGTLIASLAAEQGIIAPQTCFFFGFPLATVEEGLVDGIETALSSLPPTTFIQNATDPFGSPEAVRGYVTAHPPAAWQLVTTTGEGHEYSPQTVLEVLQAARS